MKSTLETRRTLSSSICTKADYLTKSSSRTQIFRAKAQMVKNETSDSQGMKILFHGPSRGRESLTEASVTTCLHVTKHVT